MKHVLICLVILAFCLCVVPVAASAPAGGSGWLTINCDVDGASVYLDGTSKGVISGGSLDIENGVYASSYKVTKDGYYDASGDVNYVPGGNANLEITVSLTPKPTGSGKGWFTVHSNVDGATVSFDGVTKGTVSGGVFSFEVSTTGTPYTAYSVSKSGYVTYSDSIPGMPSDGQTISLYATLNPVPTAQTTVPTTSTTIIGGDQGWYKVTCNVNGASVYLDNTYKGTISGGSLSIPVYSTGTPYSTYRVEKSGYATATGRVPSSPAKDQTVTFHVALTQTGTAAPTTVPTTIASPLGSGKGYLAFHTNVDGATVTIGTFMAGITKSDGLLTVPVSTTGTPFEAFTVTKSGYATATGTVPRQPAQGETVDIYVTMTAEQPTPVPTTQSPVPIPVILAGVLGAAVLISTRRK
ncbi:MAG: hypothetical protein LUQ66_01550 [Methanoregula sp.]|nr:hypothetical protein [Methanoregula sp.]